MTARRIVVHGRVQGVGFRFWTKRMADQREVSGWVRNRIDGTVEVHAEGSPQALHDMERLLRQGPPASSVTTLDSRPAPSAVGTGFRIEPTA